MKIGRKLLDGIDSLNEWSGKTFAFVSLLLTGVVVIEGKQFLDERARRVHLGFDGVNKIRL
jgi:hypothetical protein